MTVDSGLRLTADFHLRLRLRRTSHPAVQNPKEMLLVAHALPTADRNSRTGDAVISNALTHVHGADALISAFGHWPSFHDAEILRLVEAGTRARRCAEHHHAVRAHRPIAPPRRVALRHRRDSGRERGLLNSVDSVPTARPFGCVSLCSCLRQPSRSWQHVRCDVTTSPANHSRTSSAREYRGSGRPSCRAQSSTRRQVGLLTL